jgi:hypothetical protein
MIPSKSSAAPEILKALNAATVMLPEPKYRCAFARTREQVVT